MFHWQIWLVPAVLAVYHACNLARRLRRRLHTDHLRSVTWRATWWILGVQLVAVGLGAAVYHFPFASLTTLVTLQTAAAVFLLYHTVRTWRRIRPAATRSYLADSQLPSLSVLVPARNETIDLQNCLAALVHSDYPKLEIIALDDRSADRRTPEIIRGFAHDGVRFVRGDEPPADMLPKNHAYQRLAEEASGELLMFIGVDVLVQPDTLRRLVEILMGENRDMLSVLPMRPVQEHQKLNFIQAMRYWWELGFPRRLFNRPPVLSTLWLIRAAALESAGGFAAAKRMITPEAYFARQLVDSDSYIFMRSTPNTAVLYSTKGLDQQYATAIRVRYPQLHRRIEQVMLVTIFEAVFLLAPFVFLPIWLFNFLGFYFILLNVITVAALSVMYYLIAIRTHLNNLWLGLLTAPVAFVLDIVVMHLSMYRYEFGRVIWHDRNLSRPMQHVESTLPPIDN